METVLDFVTGNWQIFGLLMALVGGFYVPGLRMIWMAGLKSVLSEVVIQRVVIALLESLVKSTKNTLDDVWLSELKKRLGWDAHPKAD